MPCKIVGGTKVPRNERSRERKVSGTKVPHGDYSFLGTKGLGHEKSRYQSDVGRKNLHLVTNSKMVQDRRIGSMIDDEEVVFTLWNDDIANDLD